MNALGPYRERLLTRERILHLSISPLHSCVLMNFPAHFPQQCPPQTASEVKGDLFRFVNNDPPRSTDFASYHLMGVKYRESQHCEACGLSVLVSQIYAVLL